MAFMRLPVFDDIYSVSLNKRREKRWEIKGYTDPRQLRLAASQWEAYRQ
jgi:hypothetical protein